MLTLKQRILGTIALRDKTRERDIVINKKSRPKYKLAKSDVLPILALALVMLIIVFSERNLTTVLFLMFAVVLPGSLFLYWLDFRKQNDETE